MKTRTSLVSNSSSSSFIIHFKSMWAKPEDRNLRLLTKDEETEIDINPNVESRDEETNKTTNIDIESNKETKIDIEPNKTIEHEGEKENILYYTALSNYDNGDI